MPQQRLVFVQLLNCAKGQATTISAIQDFANKPENLICLLQEPWCDRHGLPPQHPDFDSFTPTPNRPKCVTYVRRTPGLTTTTTFTAQDSFLVTKITYTQNTARKTFSLLNFYSPGKPDHLAAILPTLIPPTDSILLGDLNAHHTWWQGPLPPTIRTSRASQAIADWLETHDFRLHNKIALPTHHPRNGTNPSTIDLCLSKGNIGNDILALAINHDTTSDHSSATITLTFPGETLKHQEKPRRNWNKADWPAFKTHITNARMDLSNLQGKDDTL